MAVRICVAVGCRIARMSALACSEKTTRLSDVLIAADLFHRETQRRNHILGRDPRVCLNHSLEAATARSSSSVTGSSSIGALLMEVVWGLVRTSSSRATASNWPGSSLSSYRWACCLSMDLSLFPLLLGPI